MNDNDRLPWEQDRRRWHARFSEQYTSDNDCRMIATALEIDRNRLRTSSLVQYRCDRGCFLAAVLELEQGAFFVWREDISPDVLDGDRLEELANTDDPSPALRELVEWGTEFGAALPRSVPEAAAVDRHGSAQRSTGLKLKCIDARDLMINEYVLPACPHRGLQVNLEAILDDIDRLAGVKNRVVYIGPNSAL